MWLARGCSGSRSAAISRPELGFPGLFHQGLVRKGTRVGRGLPRIMRGPCRATSGHWGLLGGWSHPQAPSEICPHFYWEISLGRPPEASWVGVCEPRCDGPPGTARSRVGGPLHPRSCWAPRPLTLLSPCPELQRGELTPPHHPPGIQGSDDADHGPSRWYQGLSQRGGPH